MSYFLAETIDAADISQGVDFTLLQSSHINIPLHYYAFPGDFIIITMSARTDQVVLLHFLVCPLAEAVIITFTGSANLQTFITFGYGIIAVVIIICNIAVKIYGHAGYGIALPPYAALILTDEFPRIAVN